jgi:hypothetical protein
MPDLPKEFFALNLAFAQKAAKLSQRPFPEVLLEYTHTYLRFGLGRDFDAQNPVWQEYLRGLPSADDPAAWTHSFYLTRLRLHPPGPPSPAFGCFSYSVWSDGRLRLHFHNAESSAHRPLSRERMGVRLAELRALFRYIKDNVAHPGNVVGGSWLYNLEAYRRLFPPAFVATARPSDEAEFQFIALWGQFVDSHGQMKPGLAARFLECLSRQTELKEVGKCFPFQLLRLECPIQVFYEFYGIRS